VAEFGGSLVAIATPFALGELDLRAFTALLEWHLASGTGGIVVGGTTGEAATLHPEERQMLCRRAVEVCRGRIPVVAGTGTNATWSSVAMAKSALSWGVDGQLVVTPYYNKPTQEGMFLHFSAVAEAARGCPIIAYDVPGRTGVTLSEETVARLARVPGIVALKDAAHDVERAARISATTRLTVLSGDDELTLAMMRKGAKGVISVAANVAPAEMARLCRDLDDALQERLLPLFKALFVESNPIPVKYALSRLGRCRNELRLPLTPLAKRLEPAVDAALRSSGVLP
jgi:4-hydroxy-tetrahydrodipicolinate synthase